MRNLLPTAVFGPLALLACVTRVPPAAVAWNEAIPHLAPIALTRPNDISDGYLRVETDTDLRMIGRETYYNLRRSYDLYSEDGHLLQADVDNRDGRGGEEPSLHPIAPGRYVVASVYGATYRKVQVVVRSGAVTEVPAGVFREAPAVFAR